MEKAAAGVGRAALEAMQKSMEDLDKILPTVVELTPTITPVLDLSDVKKNATALNGYLSRENIQIGATYSRATEAAVGYQQNRAAAEENYTESHSEQHVTFIQNNTSPKPINAAETYRNTSNQLSIAKGALARANESGSS
jgi:hypothetical protein